MAVKIISRIKNYLALALLKRTQVAGQGVNSNTRDSLFKIYVVPRALYRETKKTYPIKSRFELFRYLKSRYPSSSNTLSFLGPETNDGRIVQHYELKKTDELVDARISVLVPESLIYAMALERGNATEVISRQFAGDKKLFIAKLFDGSVESAEESVLMPSLNRFKLGTGLTDESAKNELSRVFASADVIERYLLSALANFGWQNIRTRARNNLAVSWKRLAIFTTAIFLLYSLIASVYLVVSEESYQRQIDANQQQMNALFDKQDRFESAINRIEKLFQVNNKLSDPARVWGLLLKFDIEEKAGISNITWDGEQIILSGETSQKAADLLDSLVNNDKIERATFTQPVRKRGEKESYSIAIELKQEGRANDS